MHVLNPTNFRRVQSHGSFLELSKVDSQTNKADLFCSSLFVYIVGVFVTDYITCLYDN